MIALRVLVFLATVAQASLRQAGPPRRDPWGTGTSLEWAAASPPPRHNFDALPPIRSFAPFWDLRHKAAELSIEAGDDGRGDADAGRGGSSDEERRRSPSWGGVWRSLPSPRSGSVVFGRGRCRPRCWPARARSRSQRASRRCGQKAGGRAPMPSAGPSCCWKLGRDADCAGVVVALVGAAAAGSRRSRPGARTDAPRRRRDRA